MITPPLKSPEEVYSFSNALYDITAMELNKDEYLWPQSMPSIVPSDDEIIIAQYDNGKDGSEARIYREKLIKKYGLEENIHFLDTLDETQMCEQYLKANVFVSPSAIENSPNSLGEAMLLGTPTVVSDVGGVKNMIWHETEGFVYQHDAPYMIAYYAEKFFEMGADAKEITDRARTHAAKIFDIEKNIADLVAIYKKISQ